MTTFYYPYLVLFWGQPRPPAGTGAGASPSSMLNIYRYPASHAIISSYVGTAWHALPMIWIWLFICHVSFHIRIAVAHAITDTKWHAVAGTLRCIFCSNQHSNTNTIKKALDSQNLVLIELWLLTCELNWLQWYYYTKHFRTSTHDAAARKRTPGFMLSDAIHSV